MPGSSSGEQDPRDLRLLVSLPNTLIKSVTLEADSVVGGIGRTANYKATCSTWGAIASSRKCRLLSRCGRDVLGSDLLSSPRSSRIYYKDKFFNYPLEPMNVLLGLGVTE